MDEETERLLDGIGSENNTPAFNAAAVAEEAKQVRTEVKQRLRVAEVSHQNRSYFRRRIIVISAFILVEMVDTTVDLLNMVLFEAEKRDLDVAYANVAAVATVLSVLTSLFATGTRIKAVQRYHRAMSKGIHSESANLKRKRGTMAALNGGDMMHSSKKFKKPGQKIHPRKLTATPATPVDLGDGQLIADEDNLELFIEQSDIRIWHYKCHILLSFEDFAMFLLAFYRRFYMDGLWLEYYQCMGQQQSFLKCEEGKVLLLDMQILLSLACFVYKFTYWRDYLSESRTIQIKKRELHELLKSQSSILDDFDDVSPKAIDCVICVRHLLKTFIVDFPAHVVSDINIYRYALGSKLDPFKTYQRFRDMLNWRVQNNVGDVTDKIMRENYDGSKFSTAWQNNGKSGVLTDTTGARHLCSWSFMNMIDWSKFAAENEVKKFEMLIIEQFEYMLMISNKLSREERTVKMLNVVANVKGSTLEFLKASKQFAKFSEIEMKYYTHISRHFIFGVNEVFLKMMRLVPHPPNLEDIQVVVLSPNDYVDRGLPLELVPADMGGTRVDSSGDPICQQETFFTPICSIVGEYSELRRMGNIQELDIDRVHELRRLLVEAQPAMMSTQPEDVVGEIALWRRLDRCRNDVPKAMQSMLRTLEWRKEHNVDHVRQELVRQGLSFSNVPRFEEYQSIFPKNYNLGESYDGDLVKVESVTACTDWDALSKQFSLDDFAQVQIALHEVASVALYEHCKKLHKIVWYVGLGSTKGVTMQLLGKVFACMPYLKIQAEVCDHYSFDKALYVTNINPIISKFVRSIHKVLAIGRRDGVPTEDGMVLISSSERDREILMNVIPESVLPASMLGTNSISLANGKEDLDCLQVFEYPCMSHN